LDAARTKINIFQRIVLFLKTTKINKNSRCHSNHKKVKLSKVSAGFHSRHFYSAAIAAVAALGALGVYPRTNRFTEDLNRDPWFS